MRGYRPTRCRSIWGEFSTPFHFQVFRATNNSHSRSFHPFPRHRSHNTHYFLTGLLLASLLQRASQIAKRHRSRSASSPALQLGALARSVRHSLLQAMMGERLRRNFDWTLSALDAMEDDASGHVGRLSVLEKQMFEKGVESSGAVVRWKEGGCSRIAGSKVVLRV